MRVKLRVLEGSGKSREILLKVPKFFIGRDEKCHLRPRSDLISRHHCAIISDQNMVSILDFGSRNGTLVNGLRITEQQKLRHGDELTVGPLKFAILIEQPAPVRNRPDKAAPSADDIDSWLQEPDQDEDVISSFSDTHIIRNEDARLHDTTRITKQDLEREKARDQESKSLPKAKKEPKSLPVAKPIAKKKRRRDGKPATEDSHIAASQILRELNERLRDQQDRD